MLKCLAGIRLIPERATRSWQLQRSLKQMPKRNTRQREANIRVGTETRMILPELYRVHFRHTNSMIARRLRMAA